MKNFNVLYLILFLFICKSNLLFANPTNDDIIFINNFNLTPRLNDSGITWTGSYPTGNNSECISTNTAIQDCNNGRDVTHNNNSDGLAGFSYTKIDINGTPLSASAISWSCVLDNVTGLLWENKTNNGNIHDKDKNYLWGGVTASGYNHPNREGPYYSDWDELVIGSNSENFCGKSNWKVPSVNQLASLIHHGVSNPSIDTNYFPNTIATWYWTSDPFIIDSSDAWNIIFTEGNINNSVKHVNLKIRLVSTNL